MTMRILQIHDKPTPTLSLLGPATGGNGRFLPFPRATVWQNLAHDQIVAGARSCLIALHYTSSGDADPPDTSRWSAAAMAPGGERSGTLAPNSGRHDAIRSPAASSSRTRRADAGGACRA